MVFIHILVCFKKGHMTRDRIPRNPKGDNNQKDQNFPMDKELVEVNIVNVDLIAIDGSIALLLFWSRSSQWG